MRRIDSLGYTLIELLLVSGLLIIILAVASINLIRPQRQANLDSASQSIVSLIAEAQNRSATGDASVNSQTQNWGIHFESGSYTLFAGIYQAGNSNNFRQNLPQNISFSSINLPAQEIVFQKVSGEVSGFNPNTNQLIMTDSVSAKSVTLTFNKLGVVKLE